MGLTVNAAYFVGYERWYMCEPVTPHTRYESVGLPGNYQKPYSENCLGGPENYEESYSAVMEKRNVIPESA